MRILIDTNILLDYIVKREPYEEAARKIIFACKQGDVTGCIAAHSISNIFYILRKDFTITERRNILYDLCELFKVEGIDKYKIMRALENEDFSDFEDCLQMECAVSFGADYIVTRNINDLKKGDVSCIMPDEFCNLLEKSE